MDGFEAGWGILFSTVGVPARRPTVFPNAQNKDKFNYYFFIVLLTNLLITDKETF